MKRLVQRIPAMLLHPVTGEEMGENTPYISMVVTDIAEISPFSGRFSKPYKWIFVVWVSPRFPEFPEIWSGYRDHYVFVSMKKPKTTEEDINACGGSTKTGCLDPTEPPHSCPYKMAAEGDESEDCYCCSDCEDACFDDS